MKPIDDIEYSLAAWKEGKLVALPTETVYGLGAPIGREDLLKKIFSLKKRPFYDPLIIHVSDSNMAQRYVLGWNEDCDALATRFWPGPLTIVLPKSKLVNDLITSGLDTVGVRCPKSEKTLKVISLLDEGVAAPSANIFTKVSPTEASHVSKYFSHDDVFVLDGGPCEVGIESTIISLSQGKLVVLRPGVITPEELRSCVGHLNISLGKTAFEQKPTAPGQDKSHYRPSYPLLVMRGEMGLIDTDMEVVELKEDPYVVARELYRNLHTPPSKGKKGKVILVPELKDLPLNLQDVWKSILNRLDKAKSNP